jgi:hypothetical protein
VGLTTLGSESETCVGSRVHLVGVSISFEKNFYPLPFTPPLSGSPYRSFNPESSGHTSLIGTSHRSDRCRLSVEFCSGERLGEFLVVLCCCCFEFGSVWSLGGQVGRFEVSSLRPV